MQDEKSQQVLADIRSVRQQYLDSRYRILQAVQNNNRAGAIQEMMTTTLAVQQAYKAKVKELIAIQNSEMQSAGAQVEGDFRSNRLLLILITLFSVAAGSLIGWFIVRAITRPLGEAVNFAKAISEGDLTGSITPHGKDETGLLLHALMEMKTVCWTLCSRCKPARRISPAQPRRSLRVTVISPRARKSRQVPLNRQQPRWSRSPRR